MTTKTSPTEAASTKPRTMPLYRVLLHNDDVNSMDHVVFTLLLVFRFAPADAIRIMQEAHETGVALCRIEPLETAEFHRDQLQAASLTATIEPE